MLFNTADRAGIRDGSITVAFRRWTRPTVRPGGTLTTADGVLTIDEVVVISPDEVTEEDARRAGRSDAAEVVADRGLDRDGELYRVRFRRTGEDPRAQLRQESELTPDEAEAILSRLERYDRASHHGAWTRTTLELIEANEGVRAADLALQMPHPPASPPRETQKFKTDVRKLKALGLTESLEVGYRVSPRGRTVLALRRA
ncbi:hypothetical protein BH10ACT3_BH10ACT3_12470 [soil metagenome]